MQQSELLVWTEQVAEVHKQDTCGICHESFSAATPDICRVLDCSHVFHAKCVDLWFIKATFCPLCKSDLKCSFKNTSSQRSLGGRSSHTSSQRSLGSRSLSSLRSGQILVGHSNSDPVLLQMTQEGQATGGLHHRGSPPSTPDRHHMSTASMPVLSDRLPFSFSERSLQLSPRTDLGNMSSSSSGALPAVQEVSDEARAAEGSQRSHSSNAATSIPASPVEQPRSARSSQLSTQTTSPLAEPQAIMATGVHAGGHVPQWAPYQIADIPAQRVVLNLPPALPPRAPRPVRSTSASYVVPQHAPHVVIVATTNDPAPPHLLR